MDKQTCVSISALLLVGLVAGCTQWSTPKRTPTSEPTATSLPATAPNVQSEEYDVYSAVINTLYVGGWSMDGHSVDLIVIEDDTTSNIDVDALKDASIPEAERPIMEETINDLRSRNERSRPLVEDLFALDVDLTLISKEERDSLFQQEGLGEAWDTFYSNYPHSQGIMTLSNVGFNSGLDKASVYVENAAHLLAGEGSFVLLAKVNGEWSVQHTVTAWVS